MTAAVLMFGSVKGFSWCGVFFRHTRILTSENVLFLYTSTQRRLLNLFIFTFFHLVHFQDFSVNFVLVTAAHRLVFYGTL